MGERLGGCGGGGQRAIHQQGIADTPEVPHVRQGPLGQQRCSAKKGSRGSKETSSQKVKESSVACHRDEKKSGSSSTKRHPVRIFPKRGEN